MTKFPYFLLLFVLIISQQSQAQSGSKIKIIPQDSNLYTFNKIINGLVSNGVKIVEAKSNFTTTEMCMGFFDDPTRYMGIHQGMALSTGTVLDVTKENSQSNYTSVGMTTDQLAQAMLNGNVAALAKPGDADLSKEINGYVTFDARVVEISFIPSADTLYFRYVFASEEYDEYVCSPYNDVFAFYLSEEGGQKKNIALVPNKNMPISINSVNNGNSANLNCEPSNAYLYKPNNGKQNLLYDGFTKVLDIRQKVVPGKKYILKIAIADASDGILDSAVLIENGSIFSYFNSFELNYPKNGTSANETEKLEEIIKNLKKYPQSKIQLIGHCDASGSENYNLVLSQKRVDWVKNYLQENGIATERILVSYQGELMPRYEDDAKNRRVEVFIVGE